MPDASPGHDRLLNRARYQPGGMAVIDVPGLDQRPWQRLDFAGLLT